MPNETPLADTSVKDLIFQTISTARKRGWNVGFVGAAGVGKTRSISAYAHSHPRTGLITATDALGRSPRDLWQTINSEMTGTVGGSTSDIQEALFDCNFLDVVLIIDEAQNLPPIQLREILHLNDRTRLTIVYSGNWEVLKGTKSKRGSWEQVATRMDIFEAIDGILEEDADAIAAAFGVIDAQALSLLRRVGKQHHARGVVRILKDAKERARDGMVTSVHVRAAIGFFPQHRSALK